MPREAVTESQRIRILQAMIEVAPVGKALMLTIERDRKVRDVKVIPRAQPERFGLNEPLANPNRDAAR